MIKIVGKFMLEVKEQVKEKGIKVKVTDDAIDLMIEKGFDSKMGARPLQRTIDKEIKRPLAKLMLFGDLRNGGSLSISAANGEIVLIAKAKIPRITYSETAKVDQD
jgi:ATP-dependent Clp protease ATP-binding subunit ClpA